MSTPAFASDGPWAGAARDFRERARRHHGDRHHNHHNHHDHPHRRGHRGFAMTEDGPQFDHDQHGGQHGGPRGGRRGGGDFGFPFRDFADFADFRGGPRGRGRRGRRASRGDVRAAILALLAEEPRNGYQIIQELESRSNGVWRPSPGSVYPALSQLEDEGLIVAEQSETRRTFRLTDAGRTYVEEHPDEVRAPWEAMAGSVDTDLRDLKELLGQTAFAAIQVARAGTDAQIAQARALLDETRKGLYRLLAEDATDQPTES